MSYSQYEFLKQEWINKHPNATYQEYQKAISIIIKKLGI